MAYMVYLLDVSRWFCVEEGKVNKGSVNNANVENVGLLLTEESAKSALELLCRERAEKVLRSRTVKGQAHSLGAGLLLQYIWWSVPMENREFREEPRKEAWSGQQGQEKRTVDRLQMLTLAEILNTLQAYPVAQLPIVHGPKGKPYFQDGEVHFSLSHSGDYVLCAVSDEEIGADIEECKAGLKERLVKRVLNADEWKEWNALEPDAEQANTYFYQKWTEKEARGKLTGEGILDELAVSKQYVRDICVENDFWLSGYCISVCQYSKIDN